MNLRDTLFCDPPRRPAGARPVQVLVRTVHIAAMGLVVGGVAFDVPDTRLHGAVAVTVASGVVLLLVDLYKSCVYAYQLAGVLVWVKLGLIGLARLLPDARLALYLAAVAVASIGSHMPGEWRHRRLLGPEGPPDREGPQQPGS